MFRLLTVLALIVVAAVGGVMLVTDAGPVAAAGDVADGVSSMTGMADSSGSSADDGNAGGDDTGDSTATPSGVDDSDDTDGTATTGPFAFSVDRIETCGDTCRDVTSTLTNRQSDSATNVTVETKIYAGNGTDGDTVWTGTESVGTLNADESYTSTERVDLSLTDSYAIEQNDGWATIETTINSDDETVTITEQQQVS